MHLRPRRWQLPDYVLVRRRDRQDVLVTKVIRDANGWTNYHLVISKIRLRLQVRQETRWCQLPNVRQSTALEVLGHARRQQQGCFKDNNAHISNLLAEKNRLHKSYMDLRTDATKTAFFRCRRFVKQRLREIQDAWMVRKAEEIQEYADRNEIKNLFKAIKAIYGPRIKGTAPLLSSAGTTLLTEKSQILKRWAEHFRRKIFAHILLNRLNGYLEKGLLPESQCDFQRHRGTTDIIFAARQLQEKCQEMRTHLYTMFMDLTKALDTVNCEGLWKIMQKFGG
ncbi:unnamed protein product [Schistocephalus solidus]|uniref:Reverse transcriptase domain-containing protein n=1 Tax=Schistocephalus solidus TaxID=70667 RepID=A0A183TDL0_SCHSO|nr:unnamed protein product [Schistocephalus solidus]